MLKRGFTFMDIAKLPKLLDAGATPKQISKTLSIHPKVVLQFVKDYQRGVDLKTGKMRPGFEDGADSPAGADLPAEPQPNDDTDPADGSNTPAPVV